MLSKESVPKKTFLYGFSKAVDRLLDSKNFEKYCKTKKFDAFQMAQQVALTGKTNLNLTLELGLEAVFGNSIGSMRDVVLYEKNELYNEELKALPPKR